MASTNIIANHTIVADYDKIPAYYMSEVKKMWFNLPGESHSVAYMTGLTNLEGIDANYAVNVTSSGTPEAYTSSHLRASRATWGDLNNATGWYYSYGEEDWFTSAAAINRTKAGITYCIQNDLSISAMGLGWCWDTNITATEINASYLPAMEEYIAYCTSMGYNTKMLFTTGPVDEYTGAIGYRQHMKYEAIRNYVNNHPNQGLALFDYADILCYDDNGDVSTATYDSSVYPIIATNNMGGGDVAHIGNNGATRLGKAVWWMMARIAGWNGSPQDNSTYYVSNAGNDASDGRTPQTAWRTIDKVNASMGSIQPGESVLFRRGDTFYGTINVTKSGTAENPITFGAYGTGDKPTITGFTDIMSGWASVGNGIYSRDIIADQQTNMLLIDGSQYAMGRWPKGTTYNTFESHDGSLSITDNTLPSAPDWTGADVVIRQNWWTQTRFKILDHNGTTIIYNDGSVPNATTEVYNNFGYFIQNDLSTLYIDPTYGEWYHDFAAQKLYVYFGAEDPSTKIVKVATKGNLVNNSTADYVTISNLNFIGCTSTALSFTQYMCTNITINDCSIQYAGLDGISDLGEDTSIYRNTIEYCNQGGIVFTGDNGRVQFNTIKNIGLLSGQAYMNGRSTAIRIGSTNAIVHSNYIQNIGYNGISGGTGTSASVKYNYIDNVCRTINDGGGIYHGQSNSVTPPGQWIIEYNIILNGYGNTLGTSTPTTYLAEGIYLDSYCRDASVRYNICANNRGTGIKIGSGRYNIIEDNLCFNNYEAQLYVLGSWSYPTIIDNTILRNQFIAKEATQLTLKVGLSASDNISNYGTSNYNIYARPIDDVSNSIYTTQTGGATNYRNISSWQTFSGEDANSRTSFTNVSSTNEILFYYNETNANKVVASLTSPMVDVSGNTYPVGNLTLAPWTGVVLMPNNDVSVYYLAADGSDNSGDGTIENPWFSLNKVWPLLEPGDTVYMRDGSYGYTYRQYLTGKNGTANARINIWAYPGENPHIVEPDDASFARNTGYVIYFKGDYFHWKGIEISNYKQLNYDEMTFPFRSEDSDHNIFELLTVHDCGFGIHIGGSSDDNLFLNCDVYNIYDPLSTSMIDGSLVADPYEDGDGFSIGYGGLGTTNTYRGCRAWNIADDGWDLWRSDSHVIIDRCWAWNCGYAPDGSIGGNGNGFKLGITETSTAWASNPPILRTITNSIAYGNRTCGVHQNGAYCAAEFYNNIAYKNGEFGFWMYSYNKPHIFKNNISFDNKYTAAITAESTVEYNTFLIGVNQSNSSYNVSNSDFLSIDASLLSSPRQANGDLPKIQFLHLTTGSDLIHSGTDISSLTYDGDGNLWHSPPSLGAFEFTEDYPTVLPYVATTNITNITTNSATGGGNVTDEGSSSVFAKGLCWNTSINPTILNSSTNDGTGEGSYVSYITGLNPSTHYFARAYATNIVGTGYGENIEFITLAPGEEPPHPPVTLKTFLVNPYIQTRFYVSFAGKFYILPTDATAGPEPSTYLYKRTGPGWDEYGSWAYDQFCSSFESGCIYDVSFGIVTDNPAGHFTILSEKPSWITFYDTVTGHDLDVGDHISDDPDRVFKAHPNSENTSGVDRDGSIYITNDFGQSVTFFVTQYRQPTAPTIQILPDPSDQSGLDVSSYESATIDAGYDNAAIQGLYITVPGWTAGDLDVSWRAERIFPTLGNYGYGTIGFEHKDSSFSGALIFNDVAHSGDEFIIYLKTDPLITLYVSPSNINFLKSGGDASVNVTTISTNVWNASESYDWLTLTDASGTGSGQFTVTAEQQPDGGLRRNASIYVTSNNYTRTVSISQDPSVFLYFNPNSYTFGDAGGQHDISILTSQLNPWNVSTGANWLSFAGLTSGTGSANLTLWADSQPTSGASHRTTTVGCYSEASTATLYVDQEYLSFTEVVEMREYTFAWNYNQTEEQSSTITTSFDTTLPYWYITNEANIPSWITWGVYNGTELEPSSNYQSGFTLRVHPSANTGYTARTFVFDICTGSNLSNKSLSVWQGPAPQPVSVNVDSSGFTSTINSANAYANSPYISFSVTDFDGWNATYGISTACYYTVIDASNITLINENMLTEHAEDADATNYTVTNAVMNRNAVAGDFLTIILYGYV